MKDSEFIFDFVHLLYYKCHKTNTNCRGSYTDSPDWIKNTKSTINSMNKILNHEEIEKNPERITKIKPFINISKWERINCPLEKDDRKKIEKTTVRTALNILYAK